MNIPPELNLSDSTSDLPVVSDRPAGPRYAVSFRKFNLWLVAQHSLIRLTILCAAASLFANTSRASDVAPVNVIFDTDIGNDVDDVLALSMLHAFQSRGDCALLAVTITKPDELAAPFVDAMNTFYGRPGLPIGFTHAGLKNEPSKFLPLAEVKDDNKPRYPHRLKRSSDAPPATELLRKILSRQADNSVTLVQVGYFSNLAALLDTPGDQFSPLGGRELVKAKVKLLSIMAGAFRPIGENRRYLEYNVTQDLPASRKLAAGWPTPIVWSGFEIGIAVPFPAVSIERDFKYVAHHPAAEAYRLYNPPPHERPTWDLTAVLYGVLPDRGYFSLSERGTVTIEQDGFTRFDPAPDGRDRFLILDSSQAPRVREALVQLASEPPNSVQK
jgi:purine nucleosidase